MKKEKNEGPSCACGKGDLYEEWLKTEKNKKEVTETAASNLTEKKNTTQSTKY